ncbi:hypothetical protein D3C80_1356590 [compost metagenome]
MTPSIFESIASSTASEERTTSFVRPDESRFWAKNARSMKDRFDRAEFSWPWAIADAVSSSFFMTALTLIPRSLATFSRRCPKTTM